MNSTVRRFVFTWNNYSNDDFEKACAFIERYCKYGIIGKETAPTTNTHHLQGYCNLLTPTRFTTIKTRLSNCIHIEKANGSDVQNKDYCSKSFVAFEKGTPIGQGKRTDLHDVVDTISGGDVSYSSIAAKHPVAFIKYWRGIKQYISSISPIPPRNFKTLVYFYWGEPGTGKSRRALEEAQAVNPNSIYYKPRGLWWDGYSQQECVIIDDFYGWIKYDELLKICDRYPYKVQIKGGFEEFTTKRIWITSNVDIYSLYRFEYYNPEALKRRCTSIINI